MWRDSTSWQKARWWTHRSRANPCLKLCKALRKRWWGTSLKGTLQQCFYRTESQSNLQLSLTNQVSPKRGFFQESGAANMDWNSMWNHDQRTMVDWHFQKTCCIVSSFPQTTQGELVMPTLCHLYLIANLWWSNNQHQTLCLKEARAFQMDWHCCNHLPTGSPNLHLLFKLSLMLEEWYINP